MQRLNQLLRESRPHLSQRPLNQQQYRSNSSNNHSNNRSNNRSNGLSDSPRPNNNHSNNDKHSRNPRQDLHRKRFSNLGQDSRLATLPLQLLAHRQQNAPLLDDRKLNKPFDQPQHLRKSE